MAEQILRGKFFIPSEGKYIFRRIRIAPSTIPGGGEGAFAVDHIPKGAIGTYRGVKKNNDNADMLYSWEIYNYDKNGKPISEQPMHHLDASNPRYANWARWVNCGMKNRDNNMEVEQKFDKIYYIAKKDIAPGKELFIDYGEGYRRENLKMTGRY